MLFCLTKSLRLGAYGDKHGRKINILLGIAGIAVSEYGYLLALSHSADTPLYSLIIFGVVTGATGYVALVSISYLFFNIFQ